MDTTVVMNYKEDVYEEKCRESRKEVTESHLSYTYFLLQKLCFLFCAFWSFSQESPQQHADQNDAAMDLINSVTGVDEEGRSRQRILTYAARRYCHS